MAGSNSTGGGGQQGSNEAPAKKATTNTSSTSTGQQSSNQPSAKTTGNNSSTNPRPNTVSKPAAKSNSSPAAAAAAATAATTATNAATAATRPSSSGSNDGHKTIPKTFCPGMVTMRLFTRQGIFTDVPENDVKQEPGPVVNDRIKTAMSHCFHLALELLESSTGHEALITVGRKIAERRRTRATKKDPEQGCFVGKDLNEMRGFVNEFLVRIRKHGIPVCITPSIGKSYGLTHRWFTGFDMTKYKPEEAAVIYLNKGMVDGLLKAADAVDDLMTQRSQIGKENEQRRKKGQPAVDEKTLATLVERQEYAQKSFERAIFCNSVTLAHEFVHCLTGYISGRPKLTTPPGSDPDDQTGPYETETRGEAGWMWCKETFGGLPHFWYTKGLPDALDTGYYIGTPMLLDLVVKGGEWEATSTVYTINHDVVRKLIEMKGWASEHEADSKWMHKIRNQNDNGVIYKEWLAKHREVPLIWKSQNNTKQGKALEMGSEKDIAFARTLACQTKISKPLTYKDVSSAKA